MGWDVRHAPAHNRANKYIAGLLPVMLNMTANVGHYPFFPAKQ